MSSPTAPTKKARSPLKYKPKVVSKEQIPPGASVFVTIPHVDPTFTADPIHRAKRKAGDLARLVLPEGLEGPTDMQALLSNEAHLTIVNRYVRLLSKEMLAREAASPKVKGSKAAEADAALVEVEADRAGARMTASGEAAEEAPERVGAHSSGAPLLSNGTAKRMTPRTTPRTTTPRKAIGSHPTPSSSPQGSTGGNGRSPRHAKSGIVRTDNKKSASPPSRGGTTASNSSFLTATSSLPRRREMRDQLMAQLAFVTELRALRKEPDTGSLRALARTIFRDYVSLQASRPLGFVEANVAEDLEQTVNRGDGQSLKPAELRAIFDVLEQRAIAAIEEGCLQSFLASPVYNDILTLVLKAQQVPPLDAFRAVRVLGVGGFGEVIEVIKIGAGMPYAMKLLKKSDILSTRPGLDWKDSILTDRQLHASLHHPLIVNLAYALQALGHLLLVMDVCPAGDLSAFVLDPVAAHGERETDAKSSAEGTGGPPPLQLTSSQVQFVGLEVTCVLSYLHSQGVVYRDLKPENLLLDACGHVRLIDFGLALVGTGGYGGISDEECGTSGYMAPEVTRAIKGKTPTQKKYTAAADWWTLGVLLYELTERALPFGDEPKYHDPKVEWREPKLLLTNEASFDANTSGHHSHLRGDSSPNRSLVRDSALHDLLRRLLEWDPAKRLGGGLHANTPAATDAVKSHPYWMDPEWGLVDLARLPSPLLPYAQTKMQAQPTAAVQGEQQRAAEISLGQVRAAASRADAARAAIQACGSLGEDERAQKLSALAAFESDSTINSWEFVSSHAVEAEYLHTLGGWEEIQG